MGGHQEPMTHGMRLYRIAGVLIMGVCVWLGWLARTILYRRAGH